MGMKRLLYGKYSEYVLAILIGFGLATIFRKACNERSCLVFKGPKIDELTDKKFKYDGKCYSFTPEIGKCKKSKKTVHFA